MADKMKREPCIRFNGFTEVWIQRKLGDTFIHLQNNTLSRAALSYKHGAALNIHYGDVLIKYGEVLDVKKEILPSIIDESFISKYKTSFLKNGDVIVADTAEDETVGKCTEVTEVTNEIVISGLHTIPYRPLFHFASGYLGFYMNSYAYHSQLLPLMQGIKVTSISKNAMTKTMISYPRSELEQKQIATLFNNFNNLISLCENKHNELLNVKKYFLNKMFPNIGKNSPEIHFCDFADPWEQRKLGDEMNVTSVKRILQSDWTDEGIRFLRARDIVSASKNEEPADYLFISKERYEEYSALSGKVVIGDMLVTGVGTIGIPYLISNSEPVYFKDGNIIWFQNKGKIDGDFFYYSFYGKAIQQFIKDSAGIGTVGTYTIESGKKTPISMPSKAEQKAIGQYFRNLDRLITLHQQKLEILNEMKKSLIYQMYI